MVGEVFVLLGYVCWREQTVFFNLLIFKAELINQDILIEVKHEDG